MVSTTVSTSFGNLTLPVKSDDPRILAEVKGLTLLQTIVEESNIWASAYCDERAEYEIFSLDNGEEVSIFPLKTIRKFHVHKDPHLEVTLEGELVCILMQRGQICAAIDAVISSYFWVKQAGPFNKRLNNFETKQSNWQNSGLFRGTVSLVMISMKFYESKSISKQGTTTMPSPPLEPFQDVVIRAKDGT